MSPLGFRVARSVPEACVARDCGVDPVNGASCGTCATGESCESGLCTACVPDCGARECGSDPVCGASCGLCDESACTAEGRCEGPDITLPGLPGGRYEFGASYWADDDLFCGLSYPTSATVAPFRLARSELTHGQWAAVTGVWFRGYAGCADCPVEGG